MLQINLNAELINNYNHYKEEEWDVWVIKQEASSVQSNPLKASLSNEEYYKLANFYIKYLHMAQQEDKYFIFRNQSFLYVYLSGTVVSKNCHKEKLCLEVNDGTGSITCLIEDDLLNKIKKEKLKSDLIHNNCSNNKDSIIEQASLMNFQAIQYLFKNIPCKEDFHIGNIVALTGKLTEYNGRKYVFVTKINTITIADHINILQRCLYLNDKYNVD